MYTQYRYRYIILASKKGFGIQILNVQVIKPSPMNSNVVIFPIERCGGCTREILKDYSSLWDTQGWRDSQGMLCGVAFRAFLHLNPPGFHWIYKIPLSLCRVLQLVQCPSPVEIVLQFSFEHLKRPSKLVHMMFNKRKLWAHAYFFVNFYCISFKEVSRSSGTKPA